jgi:ABC-type phosphate/phosphonate transport system substrate-binding protein
MNIKIKIKKTLLIQPNIKEKLLSIKGKLPDKLEKYLSDFFTKYEEKEKEILVDISKQMPIIYLKTIQDLEQKEREKELLELKEMENNFI